MPPRTSLSTFLGAARKALETPVSQRQGPLNFVVGNESADLDSLCSAVFLAYFRSYSPPKYALHIPVCNLPREDLRLRAELLAVLEHAGLKEDDLITLSDLEEHKANIRPADTRWLLIDHNALTGALGEQFSTQVVGCIDHHEDEGIITANTGDEPRILRKSGSCMSLLVEYCRDAWEKLPLDATIDEQLARLSLGPILVDTNNLKSKDKTTDTDRDSAEFIKNRLSQVGDPSNLKKKDYFTELKSLKEDLARFSYRDIFRKDYKSWTESGLKLGTSAVVQSFEYMLTNNGDREALIAELRKWATDQQVDIAAVLTSAKEGEFARQLLLWGLNDAGSAAVRRFQDTRKTELALEPWQNGRFDDESTAHELRLCWQQKDVRHSRKQVAPMLRQAMREASKI